MNLFTQTLLEWFDRNGRELPWRETKNPYLIWISEIILQQTRVAQGMDYFQRFVNRFPDLDSLAAAHEDEVMKYWQGLGYYSRARNLHAAARSMNGTFPKTYEGVRALKGVGDYTAAAICSFAYDMPHAVVDGNVYRVLSRYFGIDVPIDAPAGKRLFAQMAAELLSPSRPADYNQAIMDFGAMQCTPQSPDCAACPLMESCLACREERVQQLPVKQHKTKSSNRFFNYIYVRTGAYTYINKRTGNDIWKNLYELPLIESEAELTPAEFMALPQLKAWIADGEEVTLNLLRSGVKHVLSHRVIYANFYELLLPDDSRSFAAFQKVPVEALGQYAVPRLIHAFLEKYG